MKDLKNNIGLPVKLDQNYQLIFEEGLPRVSPAVRTIDEMREVLIDKTITSPKELYYMYRDVAFDKDRVVEKKHGLRYDITVIKPDKLGKELMKTAGHYHPGDFPELYEVVYGSAWCFLQKPSKKDYKVIEDVILVKAQTGDKIVCLPGYGHILINPSKNEPLVTSNWVGTQFSSDYSLYKEAEGAAYFFSEENGKLMIEENKIFAKLPKSIREMSPSAKINKFGLEKNNPIYPLINDPDKLRFLNYPNEFDFSEAFITKT